MEILKKRNIKYLFELYFEQKRDYSNWTKIITDLPDKEPYIFLEFIYTTINFEDSVKIRIIDESHHLHYKKHHIPFDLLNQIFPDIDFKQKIENLLNDYKEEDFNNNYIIYAVKKAYEDSVTFESDEYI